MFLSQRKSTTIIITTHYIEEARRAHVVLIIDLQKVIILHQLCDLNNIFRYH